MGARCDPVSFSIFSQSCCYRGGKTHLYSTLLLAEESPPRTGTAEFLANADDLVQAAESSLGLREQGLLWASASADVPTAQNLTFWATEAMALILLRPAPKLSCAILVFPKTCFQAQP